MRERVRAKSRGGQSASDAPLAVLKKSERESGSPDAAADPKPGRERGRGRGKSLPQAPRLCNSYIEVGNEKTPNTPGRSQAACERGSSFEFGTKAGRDS